MLSDLSNPFKKYGVEPIILLVIFFLTWIGFGNYMAGFIVFPFIFSFLFKGKRDIIFKDKILIILLIVFTINNVISSLLSVRIIKSTSLSLLWFVLIFIPISYARLAIKKDNDFFIRWFAIISFGISIIIILYLSTRFLYNLIEYGFTPEIFKRYSFYKLGKATTPDTLVMLGGIGYGFVLQNKGVKYRWFGLLYLLFCFFGMGLTNL